MSQNRISSIPRRFFVWDFLIETSETPQNNVLLPFSFFYIFVDTLRFLIEMRSCKERKRSRKKNGIESSVGLTECIFFLSLFLINFCIIGNSSDWKRRGRSRQSIVHSFDQYKNLAISFKAHLFYYYYYCIWSIQSKVKLSNQRDLVYFRVLYLE